MKKEHWITIAVGVLLWQLFASLVHNSVLIPYPMDVLQTFLQLFTQSILYLSVGYTIFRVFLGFIISLFLGLVCTILCDSYPTFARYFKPIEVLTKTIPNVCYIILALIWLGSEGAVTLVSFMILFPVFFHSFSMVLQQEDQELKDTERLYPETFWHKTKVKTLPQLKTTILSTSKTAASLGFKVGVMAEILGQVRVGIGRQLYFAKVNLDTASLLAWTLVIIVICVLMDWCFDQWIQNESRKEQGWKN